MARVGLRREFRERLAIFALRARPRTLVFYEYNAVNAPTPVPGETGGSLSLFSRSIQLLTSIRSRRISIALNNSWSNG